jgi:NADH-quinone oxidoreductase subunit M
MDDIWLILLLLVPLVGAVVGAFIPVALAKGWALLVSLVTLAISIVIACTVFGGGTPVFHPAALELPAIGSSFSLGVNKLSIWLVLLTTFLQPLVILSSFESITERVREYYAWLTALLVVMLGVFIARDLLLFYVFFELTLIPMFFIIGLWGGPKRREAAGRFFLYTFTGGVLMLASVVYLGLSAHTFALDGVNGAIRHAQDSNYLPPVARMWVVIGLLAGLAVKTPLFPFHTWLPLAHTEAPTAGSVVLAGVLLKLGTYGLLILVIPILSADPTNSTNLTIIRFVAVICVIGIIYGALCAWVQSDIKKLVAFSSVSHMGFCVLGLFALNDIGAQGGVLYMVNHGLSTGAMFLVIGMIYERFHTREMKDLSGLARTMPIMSFFFIFFTLSSIGLPGLNGFVSEFLTTLGAFRSPFLNFNYWYGSIAAIGIILGAVYMLHMAARVIMGPLKTPGEHAAHGEHEGRHKTDIGFREISILAPIALAVVIIGVRPGLILEPIRGEIANLRGANNSAVQPPAAPTTEPAPVVAAAK